MCGLLAYFSTDADRVDDATVDDVRAAQHCMRHRGPDENEAWWEARWDRQRGFVSTRGPTHCLGRLRGSSRTGGGRP